MARHWIDYAQLQADLAGVLAPAGAVRCSSWFRDGDQPTRAAYKQRWIFGGGSVEVSCDQTADGATGPWRAEVAVDQGARRHERGAGPPTGRRPHRRRRRHGRCPVSAADFRIRKTTRGFIISQRVGNGWERLADAPHPRGGPGVHHGGHRPQLAHRPHSGPLRDSGRPLCVAAGVACALLVVG